MQTTAVTWTHQSAQQPCPHQPVTKRDKRQGLFNCPRCQRVNFTGFSHCIDCALPLH